MKKRLPALLLALSMLAPLPARAAQPETPPVSPWACDAMYEALALGLWEADGTESVLEEITDEQLERIRQEQQGMYREDHVYNTNTPNGAGRGENE